MIDLTVEEMESLAQLGTSVVWKDTEAGDIWYDFGEEGYLEYLKHFGINGKITEQLAEKIKALSPSDLALLEQKIEYFSEHPLEVPYHAEWEPNP